MTSHTARPENQKQFGHASYTQSVDCNRLAEELK